MADGGLMAGFEARWRDFPHHILGITEEIWEGRGLGARMRYHYAPEVVVRTPRVVETGEPAATRATLQTLAEFPTASFWARTSSGAARPRRGCRRRTASCRWPPMREAPSAPAPARA